MGQLTLQKSRTTIRRGYESGVAIEARQKTENNLFQRPPPGSIQIIFGLLSDVDKICFALSDKALYNLFYRYAAYHRSIGDEYWHDTAYLIQSLMSEGRLFKGDGAPLAFKHRAKLLLRLGDKRSVYCRWCHNIHKRLIGRSLHSYLNLKPKCSAIHSTVVDICPCSAMTFHNTRNCIINCRTPKQERFPRKESKCHESSFGCETNNMQFTHECTFDHHLLAVVYVKTRVWFDEGSRSLQVQNVFKFDVSGLTPAQLKHLGKSNTNKCVHQDTKQWLQEFFQHSRASLDMQILESDYCQWLGWRESKADEPPQAFEIILRRDLGGVHWPDKCWTKYGHKRLRPPREESGRFLKPSPLKQMP